MTTKIIAGSGTVITKADAISSLRPGAEWVMGGGELTWLDQNQTRPTDAEIDAEIVRLKTDFAAKEYQRKRAPAYPPITELADALYWASTGDTSKLDAYYAACAAVKAKYPKT